MIIKSQVGWGFTTGYDPWLGDSQVTHNQNQLFFSSSGEKFSKFDVNQKLLVRYFLMKSEKKLSFMFQQDTTKYSVSSRKQQKLTVPILSSGPPKNHILSGGHGAL